VTELQLDPKEFPFLSKLKSSKLTELIDNYHNAGDSAENFLLENTYETAEHLEQSLLSLRSIIWFRIHNEIFRSNH